MSASFGASGGGGRGRESQDFDLNLAPIIDCFTVLITFMLASATFLSIGILDAGVAAAGAAATNAPVPSINLAVELAKNQSFTVKVTGKATSTIPVAPKDGKWNYEGLTQNLAGLKAKYPDVAAVTLVAETAVEYQDVVKAMDLARKTIPVVLLGGF